MQEQQLRALLVGGLAGNQRLYRQFLEALATHLRGYLRRRLASLPTDIDDLVQELLLAIHHQRYDYDPAQPLTAWVQAIARHKLVDLLRRRSRHEAIEDPLDEASPLFQTPGSEAAEARYDIDKLLALLPDRQRLPILCVRIHGASVSDTALRFGMSESAVKTGIHRGIRSLARQTQLTP